MNPTQALPKRFASVCISGRSTPFTWGTWSSPTTCSTLLVWMKLVCGDSEQSAQAGCVDDSRRAPSSNGASRLGRPPHLKAVDVEFNLPRPNYTADTMDHLREAILKWFSASSWAKTIWRRSTLERPRCVGRGPSPLDLPSLDPRHRRLGRRHRSHGSRTQTSKSTRLPSSRSAPRTCGTRSWQATTCSSCCPTPWWRTSATTISTKKTTSKRRSLPVVGVHCPGQAPPW